MIVIVEHGDGELVAAQIFPDVFNRVELGRIGRQVQQGDVCGNVEVCRNMVSRAIQDENGMGASGDFLTDFRQILGNRLSASARGMTKAAVARRCGQTAPKR